MKRYDPYIEVSYNDEWADMEGHPTGDWVKYEDVQKLVEALEEIKRILKHDSECCAMIDCTTYSCSCQRGNIITKITDALKLVRGDE